MTERLLLSAPENVDLSLIPLTEYGLRHGLLTEDDLRRLRAESLPPLRRQAERLTGGRSSSLPAETAEALLDSVFYTVSLARKVQSARLMHDELARSLFSTPNAFYRATLVDGIAGFFKLYRPALFAQETHITADYPLFLPLQNQTGIEFIERYLQNALCENGFLRCFPVEAVHELICAQHADYALIPMNLLEPALTAALLCALDGLSANSLRCAPDAAERLLRGRSAPDLAERFAAVLPALCREIHCPPRFQSYLHRCLPALAAVLAQNHPLEKPEP